MRGKAFLAASLFGGSGICVAALTLLIYEANLPVLEADGHIERVQIHPANKNVRSDLLIRTSSGGFIAIHAAGGSPYFRVGEHVKLRYLGEAGEILKVLFFSVDGKQEGVFNSTVAWPPYLFLLVGLAIVALGFRKYRQDPEGAEEQ